MAVPFRVTRQDLFGNLRIRRGDGKFDQQVLPAPLKLAVGRVDLSDMFFFGVNESTMIARYLDKDHDFRCANFLVSRRAFEEGEMPLVLEPFVGTLHIRHILVRIMF